MHVLAGMLFQISDHRCARKLERRTERKAQRSQNTEHEGRAEDHWIRTAQPNDIDWNDRAERRDEKIGRPKPE